MPKRATAAAKAGRPGAPAEGRELRARGQRTVRKLLDAGIDVFGEKGYHAARVDDIVEGAKTSHGTFYLYFSNKEDLFRALALDVAEEMSHLAASLGPLTPDTEGYQNLRAWLGAFGDVHRRYGPIIRAWTEAEIDASEFGRMGTNLLGSFVTALEGRIRESKAVVDDSQLVALSVVAMMERTNFYNFTGQIRIDRAVVTDTLAAITFASLFGASALHE